MADDERIETETAPKRKGGGLRGLLRETLILVVMVLVASTLLRMFLLQVFVIPSGSMENTLLIGDRVAVQKVVGIERGDIVVFADDLGWLPPVNKADVAPWQSALMFVGLLPDASQNYLIKRVIGMPGDHVTCCTTGGQLSVNGQPLEEASYLYSDVAGQVRPSEVEFNIVVPEGKIFVMGDHRNESADARCHLAVDNNGVLGGLAFVSQKSVVGSAVATVFPFNRFEVHSRPATFTGVPAPVQPAPAQPVINGQPPPAC